jgi:MFS family permease
VKTRIVHHDAGKQHRSTLWHNRDFILLWSGQSVSSLGTSITQTAYPLLVWDMSHSAALVGLMGGLGTLPYLLLSLMVGALVDRWDRKRVMILCDSIRALNLGSVLIVLFIGHLTVVQLCANTLLEGTCYVFFNLAEVSCLPRIVVLTHFETSCAAGAPLRMKKGRIEVATFQREDVQQSTV